MWKKFRDNKGKMGGFVDEFVEAVKQDKDLDPHEQQLLECIIDPGQSSYSVLFALVIWLVN
jgi:hypothetical protein